jgi:hypothetical protein
MDEAAARATVLVRAIETADAARDLLTDADRAWAGRAAAEMVGAQATPDAFVERRAILVLDRLAKRHAKVASLARMPSVRGWLTPLAAAAAFVVGALGADVDSEHRINLLAPPVLALLAWNLVVYLLLAIGAIAFRGDGGSPLRSRVAVALRDLARPWRGSSLPPALASALVRFTGDWSVLAAPLWRERAARLLHVCAAAIAAGAIAGLYVRGIALEFRASWQSTFLDAADVARILHVVLAPGTWLTGIAIPDEARLRAIAGGSAGENAAAWIHLYAATILLLVIVPRLVLAAFAGLRERRLAHRFPLAHGQPYFQRQLRTWREGTARIAAVPYSYAMHAANAQGLAKVLMRAFEAPVDIAWAPSTLYGADDLPVLADASPTLIVVVFTASATPEQETHGAFFSALAAQIAGRAPLLAVVDTSDFVERFGDAPRRIDEREAAWKAMLAAHGVDALFVRLAQPDVRAAATRLASLLEHSTP